MEVNGITAIFAGVFFFLLLLFTADVIKEGEGKPLETFFGVAEHEAHIICSATTRTALLPSSSEREKDEEFFPILLLTSRRTLEDATCHRSQSNALSVSPDLGKMRSDARAASSRDTLSALHWMRRLAESTAVRCTAKRCIEKSWRT